MTISNVKPGRLLAAVAALSLVATPVIVMADASAPWVNKAPKARKKAVVKKRAVRRPVARRAPAPAVEQPVQVVEAPAPVAPEPAPAPVEEVAAAPAPAPAPAPAAPVEVAEASGGGKGWLLGLLGAAAVAGTIVAVSGNDSPSSP